MKFQLLLMMIILTTRTMSGQYTFNKIYSLPGSPTTFNTVNIAPESYVVSGGYMDTVGTNFLGMIVYKLEMDGNAEQINSYGSNDQEFLSIGHAKSYLLDKYIHQCTDASNDTMWSIIVWMNNEADTLITRRYISHNMGSDYENEENIQTFYCTLNPDSTVYLANVVVGETTWNDAALQKLDKDGNTLWIYDHATMSDPDMIQGVFPVGNDVVIGIFEDNISTDDPDHVYKKIDQDGNLLWQFSSDDFFDGNGLLGTILVDNNFIVSSGSYRELGMTSYTIASAYKVDTLGNLIWHTTYGDYNDYAHREFTNIVQTTDSNYVASGSWRTIPGSDDIPEGFTGVDYDEFAYVVKFDREDGSIIWDRKYRWLEVYRDNHTLRDMKATPDGGVIFCGEVKDFYMQQFEDFQQRGWVVKLDECGCLVPGCDTTCTDIGVREQSGVLPLLLSPNPASDILNVHVGGYSLSKDAALQIIDLSGRIVSTHRIPANNTTYMMRVDELPAGNYVVQLMNEGKVLANGKVLVN